MRQLRCLVSMAPAHLGVPLLMEETQLYKSLQPGALEVEGTQNAFTKLGWESPGWRARLAGEAVLAAGMATQAFFTLSV